MVLKKVGNYLLSDTASLPRKFDSSVHWYFILITIFVSNLVTHTHRVTDSSFTLWDIHIRILYKSTGIVLTVTYQK